MNAAVAPALLERLVWRGDRLALARQVLPTGFAGLDEELPGGGWPCGAVSELLPAAPGIGEVRLLMPALAALTQAGGWAAFVAPPHIPYAPALARLGVDLDRLVILEAKALKDQWWVAEQALTSGALGLVAFWPARVDDKSLRRLQTAAATGGGAGFVFALPARAGEPSPAPLRLALAAAGERLAVRILKRRGGHLERTLVVAPPVEAALPPPSPGPLPSAGQATAIARARADAPRLSKQHANGADDARIWGRAMARGDTVKRATPDVRG